MKREDAEKKLKGISKAVSIWYGIGLAAGLYLSLFVIMAFIRVTFSNDAMTFYQLSSTVERYSRGFEAMPYLVKLIYLHTSEKTYLLLVLLYSLVLLLINIYVTYLIRKIFRHLEKTGQAFSDETVATIKRLIYIETAIQLINSIFAAFNTWLILRTILYVYEYGCNLQQEVEDTV